MVVDNTVISEVKNCPFCNGKAGHSYNGEWRYVTCFNCFAQGQKFSVVREQSNNNLDIIEMAIQAWNKRVTNE